MSDDETPTTKPAPVNPLLRLYRSLTKPTTPLPVAAIDDTEQRKAQMIRELQEKAVSATAMGLKLHLLGVFELLGGFFEARGDRDGRFEVSPRLALDVIDSEAKELQGLIRGFFQGKLSSAETTKKAKGTIYETAKQDLDAQKTYVESIEKKYRFDYKDFALVVGILYIAFAVVFLVADYPLSRKIVVQGFELAGNLEPYLLTIGITAIGIYFKIWWDEYISPGVEKIVTKNRPVNLEGFDDIDSAETENAVKTVRSVRIFRGIIKAAILLAALFTIGSLGYFRYIVYLYTEFTLKGEQVPPTLDSFWAISGFVAIALLFPFLGGICLSLGIDRIQNWKERRMSLRALRKKDAEYLQALKADEDAANELSASAEYLAWCSAEEFVTDCKELFASRYNRGYEIGLIQANLGLTLLEKAERTRRRMVGRSTFAATQPMIDDKYFESK